MPATLDLFIQALQSLRVIADSSIHKLAVIVYTNRSIPFSIPLCIPYSGPAKYTLVAWPFPAQGSTLNGPMKVGCLVYYLASMLASISTN